MPRKGTGAEVSTRIYMEGMLIENAFVNVSVSGSVGAPLQAQIELVPTNTIKHLLPFTWIHVFVTDPWEVNPKGNVGDYNLLFEGFVISKGFTKTDDGRNFNIQCIGVEVLWTQARQSWINLASGGGGAIDQIVTATSGGFGRFGMLGTKPAFGYMQSKLREVKDQSEERFMDTLISVLDDIGSVNPYYSNAKNRTRLTDRIVAGPAGQTEELFQIAFLSDFLESLQSRASGQSDLLEVVNILLSALLHEFVSVPAPPYIKSKVFSRDVFGSVKKNKSEVRRKRNRGGKVKVDLFDFETAQDNIVASIFFKPNIYTLSPPECNILFPNMYDQLSYSQNFLEETTRVRMQPQLFSKALRPLTQMMRIMRPAEIEIFTNLTVDRETKKVRDRDADAKYNNSAAPAPVYHDFDWTTNEERIGGIRYNFVNMAPAPGTLMLSSQGKKDSAGNRKGGVTKYLQNVASYEYYQSKFRARSCGVSGPLNFRPVPGFSILMLDDSESDFNVVAYLMGISHSISADGMAVTNYSVALPRIINEVDYNRPKFKNSATQENEIDFSLLRDEEGNYDFGKLFDGTNTPPVPEWFDEDYRTLTGLDIRYQSWFGEDVGVAQRLLFKDPEEEETEKIAKQEAERKVAFEASGVDAITGDIKELPSALQDDIVAANDKISLEEAVAALNQRYRLARNAGREKEEAGTRTRRRFTKIDEAFRFIGAGPLELSDKVFTKGKVSDSLGKFAAQPANARTIDYSQLNLREFIGDTSTGSGYAGVPDSNKDGTAVMSGNFIEFDSKVHINKDAEKTEARSALITEESGPSKFARYDGRPVMHDFEFRLWQESLKEARKAGFSPDGEKIADSAASADYYVEGTSGVIRRATKEEKATSAQERVATNAQRSAEESTREERGRSRTKGQDKKSNNMKPRDQAPTGPGLEQGAIFALPQPLSEKQVIDLRRAVVKAYRDELEKKRGFIG
jgi:hypothetical protein